MDNPYKLINISNINLHIGNGAKNELKKEQKLFNFKFFYKVESRYKNCSAGFNNLDDFIQFIKPINSQYYIYEYIFEKTNCVPYFDYEYEIDSKPDEKELEIKLDNIVGLICKEFEEIFEIKLNQNQFKITSSYGFKSNGKFKVSWHIIIPGYYFESNKQCEYLADKLKDSDSNFDLSVYSRDRMMRTIGSAKSWDDSRVLEPVILNQLDQSEQISRSNKPNKSSKSNPINLLDQYLITNVKPDWIKLSCPINLKKLVNKKNYIKTYINKIPNPDKIGFHIEKIVRENYHEDAYYTRSVEKYDGITFYGFNYSNRKQKCFTGMTHDQIGFYCWVDSQSNILLKCFSANCTGNKKLIGNLLKSKSFDNSVQINSNYVNQDPYVKQLIKDFGKTLLIKSNMGTGKSEFVCDYIKLHKPKRILWISVRQTYANNICSRLKEFDFVNYLDDKENFYTKPRIIVQLESLHLLEKNFKIRMYDLVVLDEIESILYHFDSSTIISNSLNTFNLLYLLCANASTKIIGMDADLDLRSIEYIKEFDTNYKLVINQYIGKEITLKFTPNKDFFISQIKKDLEAKKNICIISLSTKLLYQIEIILSEMGIKYLAHTRDTDDKFKKELVEVNTLWTKYQVIMYSPCISVGVDFTSIHFDSVYSIVVPKTASPRVFKQMLGRIRNMVPNTILSLTQSIDSNFDSKLYNLNEMLGYFKYCDHEIKITKKYNIASDSCLEVVNGIGLYDRIQMHNRIENLNKSTSNFMTQLNLLFEDSNYKIEFDSKPLDKSQDKKNKILLNDDVYRDKISNSKSISPSEYDSIEQKIRSNEATEEEKFQHAKYKFGLFWGLDIDQVTKSDVDTYFRCEFTLNRLLGLMGLDNIIGLDEYTDHNMDKKIQVVKNIIKTLGFDMTKLDIQIPREKFYSNVKILLGKTNDFSKDYANIRILFCKDKHELNENLKGSALTKLLNGFFEEFGLIIKFKHSSKIINNNKILTYKYELNIIKKYIKKCHPA